MKKIICLISLIITQFVFANVLYKRDIGGSTLYGMPSWVALSEILVDKSTSAKALKNLPMYTFSDERFTFEHDGKSIEPRLKIDLPKSHYVEFLGKSYSSITVYKNGTVEYGDADDEYENHPYVKVASVFVEQDKHIIGENVEWGFVFQNVDDHTDNFIVVNFGPFTYPRTSFYGHSARPCSIQILIYQDGEVHVQYWYLDRDKRGSIDGMMTKYDDWMRADFFDGYKSRSAGVGYGGNTVELYGKNGLRQGWIAKALNSSYAVDITEPQKGEGLHVQMNSSDSKDVSDFGGLIAYDYSREYPVVGSIASVYVWASDFSVENVSKIYCWYFNEYYRTFDAEIPKSLPYENKSESTISYNGTTVTSVIDLPLSLHRDNYSKTWEAYKNNPNNKNIIVRTDETLDYIGAPAFKFQRAQRTEDHSETVYDFYIKKIVYDLAQPRSIQFGPARTHREFTVVNSEGGIVDLSQLKGVSDPTDSYKKLYELYPGQKINGSVIAAPGYLIDGIWMKASFDDEKKETVYENGQLLSNNYLGLNFSVKQDEREILFVGEITNEQNRILFVKYKKCETRDLPAVVPTMVKTELYSAPQASQDNRTVSSAKIYNGFGGVAQRQKKIDDNEYAVSSEYSNKLNQTTRVPMTFVHKSAINDFEYVDMACDGCINAANAYYYKRADGKNQSSQSQVEDDIDRPDAENNAFTEVRYYNGNSQNNGAISASAGIAKRSFAFNNESSAKVWEIPASSMYNFIPHDKLDDGYFLNVYNNRNRIPSQNNYLLKIYRDSEGVFSQEIYDSEGLKVSSWFFDGQNEQIVVYEYDAFGNVVKTYNKDNVHISVNTKYDAQGRVVSVKDNDRGEVQNAYDSKGRLRFVRTPLHKDGCFKSYFFDEVGRAFAVGEVFGMPSDAFDNPDIVIPESNIKYVSKVIYGKPKIEDVVSLGVDRKLVESILSQMTVVRPNDIGAVVAFDENQKMVSVKLSEYNRIGEKKYQWVILGLTGAPAIQLNYDYNLSGDLIKSVFSEWNGSKWVDKTTRTRVYHPNHGYLLSTMENGKLLAKYVYTKNGNVREKLYYDNGELVFRKEISRDVYGRPTKITYFNKENGGDEIYSTTLDFKSVESNQVEKMNHEWRPLSGGEGFSRAYSYDYDYSGRLTAVDGELSASYGYDALGRIVKKNEGSNSIGYAYTQPSYRPTGVNVNGGSPAGSAIYLQYDAGGNVWYDKHNKVVYKNNKNGMPIKVFGFTSIPQDITLDDVNKEENSLKNASERIDIAYDESGDRIWYSFNNLEDGSGETRVMLPGVGEYKASKTDGIDGEFTLTHHDLIAGGYRDASGVAHFPVLDAQGNVRGYATTEGLKSAFDYYAYGDVVDLYNDEGDDNKRWQDKEYDKEHGKYYFGSRYFDSFFGLWMSPDPAGQFANPYTYGGDPVNYTDPNGESILAVVTAAIVGAIVGGGAAAYQCSKYGAGTCSNAIAQGAAVGAAAGAAGAAAGGAVSGIIESGFVGGGASSAAGYVTNGLVTGQDMSLGDGLLQTIGGAFSGALSGVVNKSLSNVKWLNYATIIRDGFSKAATNFLTEAAVYTGLNVNSTDFWNNHLWRVGIWTSSVYAFRDSFISTVLNSNIDLGLTYLVFSMAGGGDRGIDALNKWHKLSDDGEWMLEKDAVPYMRDNHGTVSASIALLDVGYLIAIFSGAGPFSHVRASDNAGNIVEANGDGVMEYGDPSYKPHHQRLTYVTKQYVGGQNKGTSVSALINKEKGAYGDVGMCVGAASKVNPSYKAGAPNNFIPWAYRNYWSY